MQNVSANGGVFPIFLPSYGYYGDEGHTNTTRRCVATKVYYDILFYGVKGNGSLAFNSDSVKRLGV